MRHLMLSLGVIGLCALAGHRPAPAAPAAKEKVDPDAAPLQGTWDWDPAAEQSAALPRVDLERVVVKGDTLTFHYRMGDERFTSVTTFTLDPKAAPKRIDFAKTEGPRKGQTYLGLYEVADGKLRICYRGPGSTRPTAFDEQKDGNSGTMFIRRVRAPAGK
jgi:uncharacterized protein (TIGR03067 family)